MPVIASAVTVGAMGRISSAMEPRGITVGVTPAGIAASSARGKVTGRAKMSAATVEVTAAGCRVPTAAEVAASAEVPASTGMTAAPGMTATAVRLRPNGRNTYQQRTQNAGCQNKAPALGSHDCHLPLPAMPLHGHFETHIHHT